MSSAYQARQGRWVQMIMQATTDNMQGTNYIQKFAELAMDVTASSAAINVFRTALTLCTQCSEARGRHVITLPPCTADGQKTCHLHL
jgi:hypothetical protein